MRSTAIASDNSLRDAFERQVASPHDDQVIDLRDGRSPQRSTSLSSGYLGRVLVAPLTLPSLWRRGPIRLLDLFGALVGLICLSPMLLVVAAVVKLSSPGPIFFRQARVGRGGQTFQCVKFRSMYPDASERLDALLTDPRYRAEWEADQKLRSDPRITPIGRLIRKFDIDELPQLWNVLRGQMSLVGPRPVLPEEAERYGEHLATVLTVKPGMTGLWQISGRNDLSYQQRVNIDVTYVAIQSALINLALILRTVLLIVFRKNGAI